MVPLERIVGGSLSEHHTSVTALHAFVCLFVQPLNVNFKSAYSSTPRNVYSATSSNLPDCSIGLKETGSDDGLKLNAFAAHTATINPHM